WEHGGLRPGMAGQRNKHRRGTAHMRDVFDLNEPKDLLWVNATQADVRRPYCRHTPGEAPTVAVKHRQRPEIGGAAGGARLEHFVEGVEIGAAMRVHDALGIAGRAARVINAEWRVLVLDRFIEQDLRTAGEQGLVIRSIEAWPIIAIHDIDDGVELRQLLPNRPNEPGEFGVHTQHLRTRMVEDIGNLRR